MDSKVKKFFINTKVKHSVICINVLVLLLYIVILILLNALKQNTFMYSFFSVIKEILLVVFSIITSTVFTSWFIEVDSRNKMYSDIVCNEFLSSNEFYETMTEENRETVLCNLEKNKYFAGISTKENMYKSVTQKMQKMDEEIYFSDFIYSISCNIKNGILTNTVKKTMKIRSMKGNVTLPTFRLAYLAHEHLEGIKALELKHLDVGDKKNISLDEKDGFVKKTKNTDLNEQMKSCGYDTILMYEYVQPIVISSDEDTIIEVTYSCRSNEKDISHSYRMSRPCHNFSLEFKLDNETAKNYALSSYAFGFADDACPSVHSGSRDVVKVNFHDWIFRADGVVVIITKT